MKIYKLSLLILTMLATMVLFIMFAGCTKPKPGTIVFWYGKTTSETLTASGIVSLTFTVDGVIIGSSAANVYSTVSPDCNSSLAVEKKANDYTFKVTDQNGLIVWSGSLEWERNKCKAIELVK